MMNRIFLSIGLVLLVAAGLVAYPSITARVPPAVEASVSAMQSAQSSQEGGVTVSGTGKASAKPNIATTSIGVETTFASLTEATSQNNAKMASIVEKLKALGVADKDIQTTAYNISPVTQPPKQGSAPVITGYRVNNQLNVTIRKIDDVGKILDAVVAAGANNIYGISFGVDNPSTYQQQARAAAVKDAQDKATQLAKAAGVQLGKVVSISEASSAPRPIFRAAAAPLAAGSEVPIESGELEINVTVEMRFALP